MTDESFDAAVLLAAVVVFLDSKQSFSAQ